jgi:cytochrome d ubiquinol oxidase subunit II
MNVLAFALLALLVAAYTLLDGYDLGVGAIHLFVARSDDERTASLATVGPFWNGNEVALIATGGAMFALFPRAYAAAFSGFYLPFVLVLWLLMGRGIALELRGYFSSDLWHGFWDTVFSACSILLAFIFGIALGNELRGVPLDASGYFLGTFASLFNGYAVLVGAFALCALALHGAAFAAWRSQTLVTRAQRAMTILWFVVVALFALTTWATLHVRPPAIGAAVWIAPAAALIALSGVRWLPSRALRFAASGLFLFGLIAAASLTLYPYLVPSYPAGSGGLDIDNSATGAHALLVGTLAFSVGLALVAIYGTVAARALLRGESALESSDTRVG